MYNINKVYTFPHIRGVSRTVSNIYNGVFFVRAFNRCLFLQKAPS